MQSRVSGGRRNLIAIAVGISLGLPLVAAADAPNFYDPIDWATYYDAGFDPMSRPFGSLELMAQAWSYPSANNPSESIGDQDYTGEYRLRWRFALDEAKSGMTLELKGSDENHVVGDDFFIKAEYTVRGIKAPVWLYGGFFAPDDGDGRFYAGVETMSFRINDLVKDSTSDLPFAGKAYVEVRYNPDAEHNPEMRVQVMAHTVGSGFKRVRVAVPFEARFGEGQTTRWSVQPHLEATMLEGFATVDLFAGYEYVFGDEEMQQVAIGAKVAFGGTGE